MSTALRITLTLHVTPLFDIQHPPTAKAYREGLRSRLRDSKGPVPDTCLVNYVKWAIAKHWFDGQREAEAHWFVGFCFGEMHGVVLTPRWDTQPRYHHAGDTSRPECQTRLSRGTQLVLL